MSRPISCLKTNVGRLHLRLRPAVEAQIRHGHPWVFAESIREQNRPGESGELAVIFDRKDQFLAVGLYDPDSPIRVRILQRGKAATIAAPWWKEQLEKALARRAGIFDAETTGGRWINGESDAFPALVLDRYADTLVLKLYSGIWFSRLAEIVELIRDTLRPQTMILRLSRNIQTAASRFGWTDGQALWGLRPESPIHFLESGLVFEADVVRGQKTGFFLDQRENRRQVGALARGRHVLNAFSFSGGFSLYAARGGAVSVTDLDISEHALASSRRNFALNKVVTACEHQLIRTDVFKWLDESRTRRFGVVILDPPSLAKRQTDRPAALKAYRSLAESGFACTEEGGVTVCCSCSAHIRAEEFFDLVRTAAGQSGRPFRIVQETREPADHHATFPEAEYLKAIYVEFPTGKTL